MIILKTHLSGSFLVLVTGKKNIFLKFTVCSPGHFLKNCAAACDGNDKFSELG
jgi:hypothetical protein